MRSLFHLEGHKDSEIPNLYNPKIKQLKEVEDYILEVSKSYPFEISFDCTADEHAWFKTINYTSFVGGIILFPLKGASAMHQMIEAFSDGKEDPSITEYYTAKLKEKSASKYKRVAKVVWKNDIDVLVVLAGANKLAKHTCAGSLKRIHNSFDKVVYKEHPISDKECYSSLYEHLKREGLNKPIISFSDEYDLYDIMDHTKYVATGFASESAFYAVVSDKELLCTDLYQNKHTAPFYHINHFLFSLQNPKQFINKAFSDYKSGYINPELQSDWKERIDNYFDYAVSMRAKTGAMYV